MTTVFRASPLGAGSGPEQPVDPADPLDPPPETAQDPQPLPDGYEPI